jgi:hypothetical protein
LAEIDGLVDELPRIRSLFDLLVGSDLDFDIRQGPTYKSNLCEQDAAFELGYTFGGRDKCGVRYSYEPCCRNGLLKNRYTLFRDRVLACMNSVGVGYDTDLFRRVFRRVVTQEVMQHSDVTVSIAAVHHYRERPPRIKAYFSCDYPEPARARKAVADIVEEIGESQLTQQMRDFYRHYKPRGGARMVGLDFEVDKPVAAKIYKRGSGLSQPALRRLFAYVGAGQLSLEGVQLFQDVFFDSARAPRLFNLVALALDRDGHPGLKLYMRPVEHYDDAETLTRLRRWYQLRGQELELQQVMLGLQAVGSLESLTGSYGFFNYISVDVGPSGVSKTSVYFVPQILLARLARKSS